MSPFLPPAPPSCSTICWIKNLSRFPKRNFLAGMLKSLLFTYLIYKLTKTVNMKIDIFHHCQARTVTSPGLMMIIIACTALSNSHRFVLKTPDTTHTHSTIFHLLRAEPGARKDEQLGQGPAPELPSHQATRLSRHARQRSRVTHYS